MPTLAERMAAAFLDVPSVLQLVIVVLGVIAVARVPADTLSRGSEAQRARRLALLAGVIGIAAILLEGGQNWLRLEWGIRARADGYERMVFDPREVKWILPLLGWLAWLARLAMLALLWWVIARPVGHSVGSGVSSREGAGINAGAAVGGPNSGTVHAISASASSSGSARGVARIAGFRIGAYLGILVALLLVIQRYWLGGGPWVSIGRATPFTSASSSLAGTRAERESTAVYCAEPERWTKDDGRRFVPCVRVGEVWRVEDLRTGDAALVSLTEIFEGGERAQYRYRFRRKGTQMILQGQGELREDYMRVRAPFTNSNTVFPRKRHDTTVRAESIRLGWSVGGSEFSYIYSDTKRERMTRVTGEDAFQQGFDEPPTPSVAPALEPSAEVGHQ